MIPWGEVITAGATIAGGLLSKQKAPKQKSIGDLVKEAKSAGIHPLAALQSPMSAQYMTPVPRSESTGNAVGGGLQRVAQMLANRKSEAELEALRASTDASRADAELSRARSRSVIAAASNGGRAPASYGQMLKFAGKEWEKASDTTDTQDVEDRYGDLVGAVYGTGVAVRDAIRNTPRIRYNSRDYKPYRTGGGF